uniref:FLZ-type domain-containing protein n=1 Tax=Oryza brachyantha TaxID=4533 RepID=J3N5N2_ORYBR
MFRRRNSNDGGAPPPPTPNHSVPAASQRQQVQGAGYGDVLPVTGGESSSTINPPPANVNETTSAARRRSGILGIGPRVRPQAQAQSVPPPPFCAACNRRITPQNDIYMFRDNAYCSEECRGEVINAYNRFGTLFHP